MSTAPHAKHPAHLQCAYGCKAPIARSVDGVEIWEGDEKFYYHKICWKREKRRRRKEERWRAKHERRETRDILANTREEPVTITAVVKDMDLVDRDLLYATLEEQQQRIEALEKWVAHISEAFTVKPVVVTLPPLPEKKPKGRAFLSRRGGANGETMSDTVLRLMHGHLIEGVSAQQMYTMLLQLGATPKNVAVVSTTMAFLAKQKKLRRIERGMYVQV